MTTIRTYQLDARMAAEIRRSKPDSIDVISARPLSQAQKDRLADIMNRLFGLTCEIDYRIREDLIGGLRIRIGDLLLDGSLRNRIKQVKEILDNEGALID